MRFRNRERETETTFFRDPDGEDEVTVTVKFDYTPAQKQTRDDPPWPAEIEINAVLLDGKDIKDELTQDVLDSLEEDAWESIPGPDDGQPEFDVDKYHETINMLKEMGRL